MFEYNDHMPKPDHPPSDAGHYLQGVLQQVQSADPGASSS
jgi:hypothetical protein